MKKQETINLIQYLVFHQSKLHEAVKDCHLRFTRRDLDSLDLLEEIIAKEHLAECEQMTEDIIHILKLADKELSFNSLCVRCCNNYNCLAQESEKCRDMYTHLVVDCMRFNPRQGIDSP